MLRKALRILAQYSLCAAAWTAVNYLLLLLIPLPASTPRWVEGWLAVVHAAAFIASIVALGVLFELKPEWRPKRRGGGKR